MCSAIVSHDFVSKVLLVVFHEFISRTLTLFTPIRFIWPLPLKHMKITYLLVIR